MTPVSRSMYDQRRPRASPWRMPSARATDQRAPFLFLAATPRMRRASPRVKGSISCDAAEGASTRAATFRVIRRRPSAGSEDYRARSVGFWLQPAQRAIDFAHQERHRSAAPRRRFPRRAQPWWPARAGAPPDCRRAFCSVGALATHAARARLPRLGMVQLAATASMAPTPKDLGAYEDDAAGQECAGPRPGLASSSWSTPLGMAQ
jgi:hypothetical protein